MIPLSTFLETLRKKTRWILADLCADFVSSIPEAFHCQLTVFSSIDGKHSLQAETITRLAYWGPGRLIGDFSACG